MKNKMVRLRLISILICTMVLLYPINAIAAGPYPIDELSTIDDPAGDEKSVYSDVVRVSYVGDQAEQLLYMEVERNRTAYRSDWSFTVWTDTEGRSVKAIVFYNGKNRNVSVTLRNASNNAYIWSSSGKWSEDNGKSVYFYIPYRYIVGSTGAGYDFNFYLTSGSDRCPDTGVVTISTIPVYPGYYNIGLAAIVFGTWMYGKRRRK